MAVNQMLTLRIAAEDLEKLDKLAALQGRPRSQLVQEAVSRLVSSDLASRELERERIKKRLRPAIKEQCAILDKLSFADEHRSF